MEKYSIKLPNKDFRFLLNNPNMKGTRTKKLILDNNNAKVFLNMRVMDI